MSVDPFQILADPTRRRILEVLRGRERAVNEVVDAVGLHQSGVSRHLRILRDAAFVRVRRQGKQRLYAIAPEPFQEVESWVAGFRQQEDQLDYFISALGKRQQEEIAASRAQAAARSRQTAAEPGDKEPS